MAKQFQSCEELKAFFKTYDFNSFFSNSFSLRDDARIIEFHVSHGKVSIHTVEKSGFVFNRGLFDVEDWIDLLNVIHLLEE